MKENFTISALIIDDDPMSCEQLKDAMDELKLGVQIVGVCNSGNEGLKAIKKLRPDMIFLDIEMPNMTGFEMLKRLPIVEQEIIFVTSFDKYAIRAIKFAALDYLLKPIQKNDLFDAVSRAIEKVKAKKFPPQLKYLLNQIDAVDSIGEMLALPSGNGLDFVQVEDVIYCESDGGYTNFYIEGKERPIMVSRPLIEYEEMLVPSGFIRIHKSSLINMRHLKKYIKGEGGQAIMSNGKSLNVGRAYKQEMLSKVSRFK